jgi:hypothetical protein
MPWAYAAMLAAALLVTLVCILLLVGGRRIRSWRIGLLMAALVGAAGWTFFTVAAPVTVPVAGDQQGAECVVNAFGENPDRRVDLESRCGQALANADRESPPLLEVLPSSDP